MCAIADETAWLDAKIMMARNSCLLVTKDTFVSCTLLLPRHMTDLFSTFGKESGSSGDVDQVPPTGELPGDIGTEPHNLCLLLQLGAEA